MLKRLIILIIVIAALAGGYAYWQQRKVSQGPGAQSLVAHVTYQCDQGKTIDASIYQGTAPAPQPGQPPVPNGRAEVKLSDGRTFTLPQTLSADGVRFSDGNPMVQGSERFVFWSKGNGALVLENNEEKSYIGCIRISDDTSLPQIYESGSLGFSVRYPAGYTLAPGYQYEELGPGKEIQGVKFTIPASLSTGTNLGSDSYVSVEEIPDTADCSAALFLDHATATTETIGSTEYSVASTTGAGAGNRYEETVYALHGTNPCIGIRSFIHYGVFENYTPGSVKAFDRDTLLSQFDKVRDSLVVNQ